MPWCFQPRTFTTHPPASLGRQPVGTKPLTHPKSPDLSSPGGPQAKVRPRDTSHLPERPRGAGAEDGRVLWAAPGWAGGQHFVSWLLSEGGGAGAGGCHPRARRRTGELGGALSAAFPSVNGSGAPGDHREGLGPAAPRPAPAGGARTPPPRLLRRPRRRAPGAAPPPGGPAAGLGVGGVPGAAGRAGGPGGRRSGWGAAEGGRAGSAVAAVLRAKAGLGAPPPVPRPGDVMGGRYKTAAARPAEGQCAAEGRPGDSGGSPAAAGAAGAAGAMPVAAGA